MIRRTDGNLFPEFRNLLKYRKTDVKRIASNVAIGVLFNIDTHLLVKTSFQ